MRDDDVALLTRLLELDTVTPMETGRPSAQPDALAVVAQAGSELGFVTEHLGAPSARALADPGTPVQVLWRSEQMGTDTFLTCQPNLVLRLGPGRPAHRTMMFNCHIDTVRDHLPTKRTARRVHGRGAVDAKGQLVAILAGARRALAEQPGLSDRMSLLVQVVGGEEGGAMGWYGTRELARLGYLGRLNVVAEPTRSGALDRTTTSMTARFEVAGQGSTDDLPEAGHNATIALAVIADQLVRCLAPLVARLGGTMCIAGCETGSEHNRVYGSGALLVNFAYSGLSEAAKIAEHTEAVFHTALDRLHDDYAALGIARRTALDARKICSLRWLKSGLPVLRNSPDPAMSAVLTRAGIGSSALRPFTCDAMWLQRDGCYTVVLGAGDLGGNRAHTDGEFVCLADLQAHADLVARVILAFCAEPAGRCP